VFPADPPSLPAAPSGSERRGRGPGSELTLPARCWPGRAAAPQPARPGSRPVPVAAPPAPEPVPVLASPDLLAVRLSPEGQGAGREGAFAVRLGSGYRGLLCSRLRGGGSRFPSPLLPARPLPTLRGPALPPGPAAWMPRRPLPCSPPGSRSRLGRGERQIDDVLHREPPSLVQGARLLAARGTGSARSSRCSSSTRGRPGATHTALCMDQALGPAGLWSGW